MGFVRLHEMSMKDTLQKHQCQQVKNICETSCLQCKPTLFRNVSESRNVLAGCVIHLWVIIPENRWIFQNLHEMYTHAYINCLFRAQRKIGEIVF